MAENIPFTFLISGRVIVFRIKKLNEIRRLFRNRLKLSSVDEATDTSALNVYKLTLDAAGYPDMEALAEQIRSVCPRIAFRRSEDESLYTVTAQGTSKGQALKGSPNI